MRAFRAMLFELYCVRPPFHRCIIRFGNPMRNTFIGMFYLVKIRFTSSPHLLVGFTSANYRLIGNCFKSLTPGILLTNLSNWRFFGRCGTSAVATSVMLCYVKICYTYVFVSMCMSLQCLGTKDLRNVMFVFALWHLQFINPSGW